MNLVKVGLDFNPEAKHKLAHLEAFIVKESEDTSKITSGIAVSTEDLCQRLGIVTQRYLSEGWITYQDLSPEGMYVDKYEDYSVPLVAKIGKTVVASVRLIRNTPEVGLPINNEAIPLSPEWQSIIQTVPLEISQLAKRQGSGFGLAMEHKITIAILRCMIAGMRILGNEQAAAIMDKRGVGKLLNGKRMGFKLPHMGDEVEYMGSWHIPVYINLVDGIANCRNAGHEELATFFETGKAPGFEWYEGI